ncbi:MAG: DUF2256 domain-containing protein [Gemmatimonas sp.]
MTPSRKTGKQPGSTNGHADKICARCGRPFSWRKKWERDWDAVRYCSDKCRMGKSAG